MSEYPQVPPEELTAMALWRMADALEDVAIALGGLGELSQVLTNEEIKIGIAGVLGLGMSLDSEPFKAAITFKENKK